LLERRPPYYCQDYHHWLHWNHGNHRNTRITAFRADLDVRHRGATLGDGQQVARPLALILDGRVVIEGTVAELRQLLLDSLQQLEIAEITALLATVSH